MADWTAYLEQTIFSMIAARTRSNLQQYYPDINYTTVPASDTTAAFPNVYIHLTSMAERGNDIQGNTINAVNAVLQVDVTTNKQQSEARTVAYDIVDALKSMRFDVNVMPILSKEGDIHRAMLRARRTIGNGDLL